MRRRGRLTLGGQLLLLQLAIVLVVLVAVAAVSVSQSSRDVQRVEGRRALATAENVAANSTVRAVLDDPLARLSGALAGVAESARTVSGSSYVVLARPDRTVVTSPDPREVGTLLPLGASDVLEGRSWTGLVDVGGERDVVAHVPVLSDAGRTVGLVAVGRAYPSVRERLGSAGPDLLTYLGVASVLGVAGSLLLARRVRRQTLGLEPGEITRLAEDRVAMLRGIHEGVLGLDAAERVTLLNDTAADLLGLTQRAVGRSLDELGVDERLHDVLAGRTAGEDQVVVSGGRVLVLNRVPLTRAGRDLGSVTTLRDRTELVSLQRELGASRGAGETLRAQTHEFANRLHTISGLIQLGEYDEVVRYVDALQHGRAELDSDVTGRVDDPALAALLMAKVSLARERGVELRLGAATRLGRVDDGLGVDLTTVVGNLVDNALDAVAATPGGWVEVTLGAEAGAVVVEVRDSGPGVASGLAEEVFRRGFTTKAARDGGARGVGLALTRLVCERRGGSVDLRNDPGAVFTARLPARTPSAVPGAERRLP